MIQRRGKGSSRLPGALAPFLRIAHLREQPWLVVIGASGSGKSTLMNILGGLDVPTAGRAIVADHDVGRMRQRERARLMAWLLGGFVVLLFLITVAKIGLRT